MNGSSIKSKVSADAKTLFVNVMLWDGTLSPSRPAEVLVLGNVIEAIGTPNELDRSGALVIDGRGYTLMPGLVDGHGHITFNDSFDFNILPEEHTLITMHGAKKLLDAGFTSVFSGASAKVRLEVVIRNEINSGRIPGPRLKAASPELTSPGSLGDGVVEGLHLSNTFGYPVVGVDAVIKACNMFVEQGVDNIKVNISGEEYITNKDGKEDIKTTFTEEEVKAAIETCHKHGKISAAHCRGSESVKIGLKYGVDVLYHCEYADDETLALMVKNKDRIFLGPAAGFLVKGGASDANCDKPDKKAYIAAETYKKLYQLDPDMRVLIGGDYGFPPTPQGTNAFDLEVFVKWFNYPPIRALVAGTAHGGLLMGNNIGQIKKGYLADMLLVKGDPTADVTLLQNKDNLKIIMLDGYLYKNIL